jgi:hypothetical protein
LTISAGFSLHHFLQRLHYRLWQQRFFGQGRLGACRQIGPFLFALISPAELFKKDFQLGFSGGGETAFIADGQRIMRHFLRKIKPV